MYTENVVSIRSRVKPVIYTLPDLSSACAAAALIRRGGVSVEVEELEDGSYILRYAA